MKCTTEGCSNDATLGWARIPTDAELEHLAMWVNERHTAYTEDKKLSLRVRIAALTEAKNNPPKLLSPQDREKFEQRAQGQIDDLQQQHDQLKLMLVSVPQLRAEKMIQAVATCPEHKKHEDVDWYARVHQSDCSGELDCGCPA